MVFLFSDIENIHREEPLQEWFCADLLVRCDDKTSDSSVETSDFSNVFIFRDGG